jgi:high affinity Mn2+ porin
VPLTAHAIDNEALLAQIKALVERVERLEAQNTQLRSALESDRISENEPELVTRLKAVEAQQQALQTPANHWRHSTASASRAA